jgi:hypothetical protein
VWAPYAILPDEQQKTHRTRVLAEMVKRNTVLRTINLSDGERDGQIYTQDISPRLEMNLYRPRVLAISKADILLRRALLGLALRTESVRNESNLIWMFISRNADVVLQSDEDREQVGVASASVPVEVAASVAVEGRSNW